MTRGWTRWHVITGLVGDVRLRVTAASPDTPVFVAIGPSGQVAAYLSGLFRLAVEFIIGAIMADNGLRHLRADQLRAADHGAEEARGGLGVRGVRRDPAVRAGELSGLSQAQVRDRVRAGQVNTPPSAPGRTIG